MLGRKRILKQAANIENLLYQEERQHQLEGRGYFKIYDHRPTDLKRQLPNHPMDPRRMGL